MVPVLQTLFELTSSSIFESMHQTLAAGTHVLTERNTFYGSTGEGGTWLLPESMWKHSSKVGADKESETLKAASHFIRPSYLFAQSALHGTLDSRVCSSVVDPTGKGLLGALISIWADKKNEQSHWSENNESAVLFHPLYRLDFNWSSALLPGADGLSGEQIVGYWGMK